MRLSCRVLDWLHTGGQLKYAALPNDFTRFRGDNGYLAAINESG